MPRSVLIVEDDPPLRGLLETLLRRTGAADVVSCADGEEAIELLAHETFDVILLDLVMPRKDGLAVIDFLRRRRPAQLRVVLVMTVVDDLQMLDPQVVHGVIAKPFENDAVVGLVLEILRSTAI
jgi:two-component system response regulator MprA